MTPRHAAFLALALAWAAHGAAAAEHATIEGVWSFERVEVEGTLQETAPSATHRMVIAPDGSYTIQQGTQITRGRLTLDAAQSPKHYDAQVTGGRRYPGIYELTAGRLRVCLSMRDERPADFVSGPGSGRLLFVFRREDARIEPTLAEIARMERSAAQP